MPRHFRLSREEIGRLKGTRLESSFFSVSFSVSTTRKKPAVACVVSKKIVSSAVSRNRLRRRLRAALLPLLQKTPVPVVCIWHIKKPASQRDRAAFVRNVEDMWRRIEEGLGRKK